jgi:hypothetical protein
MPKFAHSIEKLDKVAENCNHNIDPLVAATYFFFHENVACLIPSLTKSQLYESVSAVIYKQNLTMVDKVCV